MDTLDGMKTVVAVVETGSFTAAGERLGISKALVSKYIGEVEKALGVRLFNRSTRRLALTEGGQTYYQRVIPLIEEFTEMLDHVSGDRVEARGQLRISVPVAFGEMSLAPLLPEFLARYPNLSIDLQLTDRMIDMLQEGVDVVVRLGSVDDSSLVAREITRLPLILAAAPAYLQTHARPVSADDLESHTCIIDSNFRVGHDWPLTNEQGETRIVHVKSRVSVNSPSAVREICIAGGGLGLIPAFIVQDALQSGQLIQLLPNYKTLEFGMYAIYPHRRYLSKKMQCFITFLQEKFGSHEA